jgi:1-deoxy-D-xylulose-5-phosphate reductoisomerase
MVNISILGSTGSIGTSTLEVVARLNDRFSVVGLSAGGNVSLLVDQVERFRPKVVSVRTKKIAQTLRERLKSREVRVVFGPEGAEEVAGLEANDMVVSAITGIEGLRPTLAAIELGRRIALANKESLVVAGGILCARAKACAARIIPVDSEHSGIFQCLAGQRRKGVKKVTLTASGGPFFRTPLRRLRGSTVEEALAHPRWKMGRKVTIDSATLMNKGLELIEARWLFGLKPNELDILIHPQSIVHSLVEMRDGSTLAQLSVTDMKIPIQYALTYPERAETPVARLDLSRVRALEFFAVDERRYPLIRLARQALETEKSLPVALNAANEVAVEAFLNRRIDFSGIAVVVGGVLDRHELRPVNDLESVFEIDLETRRRTENFIRQRF